ncbi:MAG TPA: ABC transporter substrate-binding protein [Gaiellaceae bacterium]|jgi:peptide/nickel transport system substrate-binding protein|nr:ABC transporter substrate-binding protein [Gaiellaceae bacterium]
MASSDRQSSGPGGAGGDVFGTRFTRRRLLHGAAAAGLTLGSGGLLAACGGDGEETVGETGTTEGAPRRGGRLRVAHVGAGRGESFNPARGSSFIDASRYFNVFDPLSRVGPALEVEPGLALEWNPNEDSTLWEVKLRPDVVWHDGKPFTADDVIYTFRQMGDASHVSHASVLNINLRDVRKVDDLTLEIPLKSPNARLFDSFVQQNTVMVQDGARDFTRPVGTGPFMFESFTVGQRSLCSRNPNYWDEGKPYVDEWEDISIDDNAARLNALLAGEVDMISQMTFAQAKQQQETGDIQVIAAESPALQVFLMAVDIAPFDDVRVREAFRLIPDRQALIDGALFGFGTVGNDLAGKGMPFYAEDLPPREQDLEQAAALLREAGHESLEVTLHTSDIVPGFVEAATLFAEQAQGANVTVNVKREPANAYFDTSLLYTKLDFAQSFWTYSSIPLWYEQALLSDAVWNETHWRDPETDRLIRQAQGAPDEETATELWHQIQQTQYEEGGYIVWAYQHLVDGAAQNVQGIEPSSFFNLGGWNYRDVYLT